MKIIFTCTFDLVASGDVIIVLVALCGTQYVDLYLVEESNFYTTCPARKIRLSLLLVVELIRHSYGTFCSRIAPQPDTSYHNDGLRRSSLLRSLSAQSTNSTG